MLHQERCGALPDWMIGNDTNFSLPEKMMSVNDDANLTEGKVRAQIKQLFSRIDIDVDFIEEEPPCEKTS